MPCPEVKTGHVEIPGEDYTRIQHSADAGRNLWRLDPIRTAQVVGSQSLGFRPNDVYTFVERYRDPGSGLQHAIVRVQHGPCRYVVTLYQPVRQGPRGIWVMHFVDDVTT
ncbi:hypothetical protein [Alicyclobacillus kakegawensis]|uniref:hypothetical protein n=1 Tax=Alicyclobacillus kakegawensis TaxID=392012 RepID=UPI0008329239|nr:hypothetical protein [Alicyclobacillus kakegawensis]